MFGIWSRRKITPLNCWYVHVNDFQTSTPEFYEAITDELTKRQVPGLEVSHVEFPEGGPLSPRRQYLRLQREWLVFDICSSSMGTGWFFSCRYGVIPMRLRFWKVLVLAGLLYLLLLVYWAAFGLIGGIAMFVFNIAAVAYLLNSVLNMGFYDLDALLLKVPLVGTVYERLFRRDTYYRDDTRRMYCDVVNEVVQGAVVEYSGVEDAQQIEFKEDPPDEGPGFWAMIGKGISAAWRGLQNS